MNKFFSRAGGCIKNEQAFRALQSICEDQVSKIEKIIPDSDPTFLLQIMFNCQKIGIKDKFFYDSIIQNLDQNMTQITRSEDFIIMGAALGMNPEILRDNAQFVLKFYDHTFKNRFLIKQKDKQVLSRLFSEMNLSTINKKHLDIHQDVKQKDAQKQAFEIYQISPPENLLIDFDFENRVVIIKNKKTQQMIILFGSDHHCEDSINFGKQLMDTFKPQTIMVEEKPIETLKQELYEDDKGNIYPQINDLISVLKGQEYKSFIQESVIENPENFTYDSKKSIVYANNYNGVGIKMPTDFPTYAAYHLEKQSKFIEDAKIVLCDLSQTEMASSFILSMDQKKRRLLQSQLKYQILLDTTSWISDIHRSGCQTCASFLNRNKVSAYPSKPVQLLSQKQMPSFKDREQSIAYSILRTMVELPKEQNFVVYVGNDHLLGVTKQMVNFLNNGEQFMSYKRPPQIIGDKEMLKNDELRHEYLKRQALSQVIYDDNEMMDAIPPFVHTKEDLYFKQASVLKQMKNVIMGNFVNDIDDLHIEFNKDEDYIKEKQGHKSQQLVEDDKYLKEYLDNKGGRLKCLSLSYMQGNFAYLHSQRHHLIDESFKELGRKSINLVKNIDDLSEEENNNQ
ncbi:UNKNOWN [Stylonychia lemnae]|uniref:Uncharacterized protein n=1 Tax=Stylonychia lemnae TaxID=5949 RepID=A0A078A4Y7_STYLE|nr:UNKNOWN [Stylonychia lemnae]|eukprot:CDW77264.1 UNKNOWN [Stylonychia lemnae]